MIIPTILCGGIGSRLWPVSRQLYPKQFNNFIGQGSLMQQTLLRFQCNSFEAPILMCSEEHRFLVAEQMRQINVAPGKIVLEPTPRSTAPAAVVASLVAASMSDTALVLIVPSDHVIANSAAFVQAVNVASNAAENGHLVTFGIEALSPHTGYGYIEKGNLLTGFQEVFSIKSFIEKPNLETAENLLETGDYLWNGGVFLFSAHTFLEEVERFCPEILGACKEAVDRGDNDMDFFRLDHVSFSNCPSGTIDVEIMEKTDRGAVVAADIGWSDVGSWSALWDVDHKDNFHNVVIGDVVTVDVAGSYLRSDGPMLAAIGLDDIVIVTTEDAVLVAAKERTEEVKTIVERFQTEDRPEGYTHMRVYRPWGWYQGLDAGQGFQVKRINVNPGARLSLQFHNYRAEHWIVVSGKARVTCGNNIFDLTANQSTYIPVGEKHRLENIGDEPLNLIEVQSGDYLGEDDIVRLDDDFKRT